MHEALLEEEIVNKVGGRFKLSTLIQKRLLALQAGSRPLVSTRDLPADDKVAIVIAEILQDKIFLDTSTVSEIEDNVDDTGELDDE